MMRLEKLFFTLIFILSCWNFSHAQVVWPGDVDNNGRVDNLDLLYIGIAQDAVGTPRLTVDSVWMAHPFTPWGITFPDNNLDYAYADCNGDGVVDEADFEVALFNFYRIHSPINPPVFVSGTTGTDPKLFFQPISGTTIFEGDEVFVPIHLGTATQPVTDFYGISFTIKFDPLVFQPFNVFFSPIDFTGATGTFDTWITTSGEFYAGGQNFQLNPDPFSIDVTIVKTDGVPITEGDGMIGGFFGIIEENVVALISPGNPSANSVLEIQDIRYINQNLEDTPIVNDTTELLIFEFDTTLLSNELELLSSEINLYPNPAKDRIFIQVPDILVEQLMIVDQAGKVIYRKDNFIQEETIEISTSNIPSGFYFVKLLTDQGLVAKKVSIRR